MNRDALIRFLTSSNLLGLEAANNIASRFEPMSIANQSYLLKSGKISDTYLFLEKGFMRAYAVDPDGNEITTAFYASPSVVFEVSSFFHRVPSKENIVALTDCIGWFITYQQLNDLFHGMPEFREFGRYILVTGFASLKSRMLSTITETAEQRYERLLQSHPEVFQHAPLKHIASFLGITDTSLSRIRKSFTKKSV
jgi:CRP-like cAMP-binding protein